jgi:hypothetical protein
MISFWKQVACAKVEAMVILGSVMMQWKMLGTISFAVHRNQPLVPNVFEQNFMRGPIERMIIKMQIIDICCKIMH